MVLQAAEDDQAIIGAADLALRDVEFILHAEGRDLVLYELLNAIRDACLNLTDAGGADVLIDAIFNEVLREEMRLRRATAALGPLEPIWG
jgi:hypothetical protein